MAKYLIMQTKLSDDSKHYYRQQIYSESSMDYYNRVMDRIIEAVKLNDPGVVEVARWVGERGSEPPSV